VEIPHLCATGNGIVLKIKMSPNRKEYPKRLILETLAFSLLVSGCVFSRNDSTEHPNSVVTITPSFGVIESPSPTTTATPTCTSSIINVNELVNGGKIDGYHWSDDGKYFYIQTGSEWWQYEVTDQVLSSLSDLRAIATNTPSAVENLHRAILGDEFDSLKYRSTLSPDGTSLVYWDIPNRSNRSIQPTSTPDSGGMANEYFDPDREMEVFLLESKYPEPISLGRVPGYIREGIWFQDNERVVLEVKNDSTYNLWLADKSTRSLTPLLSKGGISNTKLALLDVSPDGNWAMYQNTLANYASIVNVNDLSVIALHDLPRNMGAWWLPNGEQIVAIAALKPDFYSFLLYNVKEKALTEVLLDVERGGSFRLLGASDNDVRLVHIKHDNPEPIELELLNLCLTRNQ
jgi:hypothetical protein